ncbi:WD domain, G-beta repeat protein (macronuclear) [Tetrahymena thermophila SB210]|uniref:WD domain, G-beta repeat protein n=1 Tax=Tetrahymena thermophila (strain SB210) TaxID=312017 RepID=I7MFZ7_TETTS|nr:WD domain, G-beta repeat protein [Tetrahymena thermophila SB210]EAR84617.2 WD domain, G-beta repeat protein [Tetrahymena thermophila SB210]|eukprot:XP_001032280.2 WD domain, G-beta repeat protein [Tetrahymena thermophila SB210]
MQIQDINLIVKRNSLNQSQIQRQNFINQITKFAKIVNLQKELNQNLGKFCTQYQSSFKVIQIEIQKHFKNEQIEFIKFNKNNFEKSQQINKNLKEIFQDISQESKSYKQLLKNEIIQGLDQKNLSRFDSLNLPRLLGGGGVCFSSSKKNEIDFPNKKQKNIHKIHNLKNDEFFKENGNQNQNIDNSKEAKSDGDNQDIDDFQKAYKQYFNKNAVVNTIKKNLIASQVRKIIEKAIYDNREEIIYQNIREKVVDLINLIINYLLISIQNNEIRSLQNDIDDINVKLKQIQKYSYQNRKIYPCLDLYLYLEFLIAINSQRSGLDTFNQSLASKIAEKFIQLAKTASGFLSIAGAVKGIVEIKLEDLSKFISEVKNIFKQLAGSKDNIQSLGNDANQLYDIYQNGSLFQQMYSLWIRKTQNFGNRLLEISSSEEIIFYLKEISEKNIKNQDLIKFIYMQINYLLEKEQKKDNLKNLSNELKEENNLIIRFVNELLIKKYSKDIIDYIKQLADLVTNSAQFRYLQTSILLKLAVLIKNFEMKDQEHEIMVNLCLKYIEEKDVSVKIVFKNNQLIKEFIHSIDKYEELIINEQKQLKRNLTNFVEEEKINQIQENIQDKQDLVKYLANSIIQMWEIGVKQRQEQNQIAHKDDILLEAVNFYVKQQMTFIDGKNIFKENSDEQQNQKDSVSNDALTMIIKYFLIPNYKYPKIKSQNNEFNNQQKDHDNNKSSVKIISILADGGTGKSMLLKKIEVELINSDSVLENQSSTLISDERAKYIPIIIKCNSLDANEPTIEKFLVKQNFQMEQIESLKKSERNKLLMLDGYDEFAGEYFKIFEKLKIYEWVNTLVIVTSRLEKISISDARVYFNYYNEEGKQENYESYVSMQLEKFTDSDIKDYFNKFEQISKITHQNQKEIQKIKEVIFQNNNLIELVKLPVNLYLTTRMLNDLDLKDDKIFKDLKQASDQVDIQELFFQQQFSKKSKDFTQKLKIKEKIKQNNIENLIKQTYFEYLQNIAMHMFLQKKNKSNFLSTNRKEIHFEIKNEIDKFLDKDQMEQLKIQLNQYVDSRVITRMYLSNQINSEAENNQNLDFEFRHKSIFEYFAARAMKYDFDLYQESIYKLPLDKLVSFNINQTLIMNIGYNKSEQQILLKLFKLIDHSKNVCNYQENYTSEDIKQNNRYFQYIRRSQIDQYDHVSKIDMGASNLLSALFVSRFAFDNLTLRKCSFSKAYISYKNNKRINFDECNLNNALLKKVNPQSIESSMTQDSIFDSYQKIFSSDNFQNFKKIIYDKERLISINDNGYINSFEQSPEDQKYNIALSKKITNFILNEIKIYGENQLVVSSLSTLFLIDSIHFSIKKLKKFDKNNILNFDCQNKNLLIQLNNKNYYGNFEQEFKEVDFCGQLSKLSTKCEFIAASVNNQLMIYQIQKDFQKLKTLEGHSDKVNSIEFQEDGKFMISASNKDGFDLLEFRNRDGRYIATGYVDKFYKIWKRIDKEVELIGKIEEENNQILSIAFAEKRDVVAVGSKVNCKILNMQNKLEQMQVIECHGKKISSVVFSPNGQYIATGSTDTTCKIWKINNQGFKLFKNLEGHSGEVSSIAFSSDSKYLATSSYDKTAKIWDLERQFLLIHTIQGHSREITQLAFSKDNKYLATVSYDKTCRIWSCQKDFQQIKAIQDYTREVTTVAFSEDSKYLATGSYEKTCKIFDIERDFSLLITLQDHTSIIAQVKFSKDGRYLATCSYDNTCKIWSVKNEFHLVKTIDGHKEIVYSISFSEDSKYLATGSKDKTCKVWDIEKQFKLANTIQRENEEVTSLSFSIDNKYLAISSFNILNIYNAENRLESINQIEGHQEEITAMAFSNDCKYLATSSLDQTCKIWNIENRFELQKVIQDHTDMITCVAFSNDNKYLATSSFDQTCRIWDTQKGFVQANIIQGETEYVYFVAFSPDCKHLAIGYMDYYCQVLDIQEGFKLKYTLEDEAYNVASMSFSDDGKYFSTGSEDNTCKIWDSNNNFNLVHTIKGHESFVNSVCFSPDSRYLVTGSLDKTFKLWNAKKNFELIHTIEVNSIYIVLACFSKDSRYLLTSSEGSTCEVLDVEQNFKLVYTIEGNNNEINSISISSDGNYLAIGSQDSTGRILDLKNAFLQRCHKYNITKGFIELKENQINGSIVKQSHQQELFENIYIF